MSTRALPDGYERIVVGRAEAVAVRELAPMLQEILGAGTLYDAARVRPDAQTLAGRQPAYAIPMPDDGTRMVVRHNRHGGLLARVTGDRFLFRTRAPFEFKVSNRLRAAGVPTPELLAYVVYRAGPFAQSDVVTGMVEPAWDLARGLAPGNEASRDRDLELAATLVAQLSRAGARHHDLNTKNVLIGALEAIVLDVDRVTFGWAPELALAHNLRRLDRSLRKRRQLFNEAISDAEIAALSRAAAERL
ncbi:MAG: lipopolysaccharide kinase InaA family protein [Gemmatimonadaceae bacterium]